MTPAMRALRESVAFSEKSHVTALRAEGRDAYEALDRLVAGDLFAQSGRMRHTLLLRDDGTPLADVYVCARDDDFLLLAEGPPGEELRRHLVDRSPAGAAVFHLLDDHAVLGLDGPFAWEAVAQVVGPDVMGLPYLTFFEPAGVLCFRGGKTGEYGYDLLVPRAEVERWRERILEEGRAFDLERCTMDELDQCALELQLQWRVSRRKAFVGSEALEARRRAGISERLVCVVGPGPFGTGDPVAFEGRPVGRVVNAGPCDLRGDWIGMALVEVALAHAGIAGFEAGAPGGSTPLRTVAPPALSNRSLFVQPQRHSYLTRAEVEWPPIAGEDDRASIRR